MKRAVQSWDRAGAFFVALLCLLCALHARAQPAAEPAADAGTSAEPELAQLDDSVARLAEAARQNADTLLAAKDYPGALKALQQAHELDPKHAGAATKLAELYALLGNYPRSEQTYREALALDPEQAPPHVGLAELLARDSHDAARLGEAASLLARARALSGNDPDVVLRQARVAALLGRFEDAEREYLAYLELSGRTDAIAIEIGDFYRDEGRTDQALGFYRSVSQAPESARIAAQRIFELDAEREARELGLARKDEPIAEQARVLAQKARLLADGGDHEEAERMIRRAISLAPGFSAARAELGDLLHAEGRNADAELEYLRALALDPTQLDVHLRLAELYLADPDNERASEAALILERALGAHPELPALHLRLSRAYQRAGDLPRALFHAKRFLAQAPPGPDREAALGLQRMLERLLGATPEASEDDSVHTLDVGPIARARAYLARGRSDAALAELRRVPNGLRSAEVLLLEARVLRAAGRSPEAARVLEQALARDPAHAEAEEELGSVSWSLGREDAARAHFAACEQRGRAQCSLELAQLDARDDRGALSFAFDAPRVLALLSARARLQKLMSGDALALRSAELRELRARVDQRLLALALAALVLLAALVAALLALRARVFGGSDVAELIVEHPEAGPEAMRILSSIRHEVLKHNSMALAGVTQALRRAEPVNDKAAHLERALFGEDPHDASGGAYARLLGYAGELHQLGRAHGVRLNLTRRDRALAPLLAGFGELAHVRDALADVGALSERQRARLLRSLESASGALHERGYAGLRETLDRIRFCALDRPLLERIFERTRAEPAFAGAQISPLTVDSGSTLPCAVRMPEHALADVLTNLLRNALAATLATDRSAVAEVGVTVQAEVDPATGDEHIAISVLDRAPGELPARALRARYIEAGLGLTADLVARYEGVLDVEPHPDWSKAVVLRLPGSTGSTSTPEP